jgi:glycosyltransferase involved in cell wall biosynthesis
MHDAKTVQQMISENQLPFVSIVMPVRNEADFIEQAIRSILGNDYPADKMEVIVADGCSTDGTQAVVTKIAREDSRVGLLENPGKIVSAGLNLALKTSRGEVFIRIDGHCEIPTDFIKKSVHCLSEHPYAWIVGGYIETLGDSYVGRAIASAMKSPIGVGNAYFRLGDYEGWVDTLAFGAHHKWILDRIGYFDEELVRNQDDEFNFRVVQAGGKIWMSKSIRSKYFSRGSLNKLWRQYFQYGFWRVRTFQKHRKPASVRQLAPFLFVLLLSLSGLSTLFWRPLGMLSIAELALYTMCLFAGALGVGCKSGWRYAPLAPVVFVILHFGYGLGSLWGIVRFTILKGYGLPKPEDSQLSR